MLVIGYGQSRAKKGHEIACDMVRERSRNV